MVVPFGAHHASTQRLENKQTKNFLFFFFYIDVKNILSYDIRSEYVAAHSEAGCRHWADRDLILVFFHPSLLHSVLIT